MQMFSEKLKNIEAEIFEIERIREEYKKQKNKLRVLQNVLLAEHEEYIEKTFLKNFMKKVGLGDVYVSWKHEKFVDKHIFTFLINKERDFKVEVILRKDKVYDLYEAANFNIGGMSCKLTNFNTDYTLVFDNGVINEDGIHFRGYGWTHGLVGKDEFLRLKSVIDFFIKGWNFIILMQKLEFYNYKNQNAIYIFHIARMIYWSSRNKDGAFSHFPKEIVKIILEKYLDCPYFHPCPSIEVVVPPV